MLGRRKGLLIAVLGPDGAGKSTLIAGLESKMAGAFRRAVRFHLMPGLLRRQGDGGPVTDPHGKPPRSWLASVLKLAYYWLDYTLGYWLKIRPLLVRSTLVLFDRYYDDLLIDPRRYRYGGPMWAARLLRRLIPCPDLFLVLDAPKEQLLERKQEVAPQELDRQVRAYREFTVNTPNAVILNGDVSVEEVTAQARDILLEHLHLRYLKRRRIWFPPKKDNDLLWLTNALGIALCPGRPTHAFLRLPDGRGYLLPIGDGRTFRSGLDIYHSQADRARLVKSALRSLSFLGIKAPGLSKIHLGDLDTECGVLQTLREVFARKDLVFAISLGTPGPHRKPVLKVMTPSGEVLGFAKVGWNAITQKLVQNETLALRQLSQQGLKGIVFPEILYVGQSSKRFVMVTKALSRPKARLNKRAFESKLLQTLTEITNQDHVVGRFADSIFWSTIKSRADRLKGYISCYERTVLERVLLVLEEHLADVNLPWTWRLGDVTPWNAWIDERCDRLYVTDLENATPYWLPGWDLFHFVRATTGNFPALNTSDAHPTFAKYYRALGLDPQHIPFLYLAYLVDLFTDWQYAWVRSTCPKSAEAFRVFQRLTLEIYTSMLTI